MPPDRNEEAGAERREDAPFLRRHYPDQVQEVGVAGLPLSRSSLGCSYCAAGVPEVSIGRRRHGHIRVPGGGWRMSGADVTTAAGAAVVRVVAGTHTVSATFATLSLRTAVR